MHRGATPHVTFFPHGVYLGKTALAVQLTAIGQLAVDPNAPLEQIVAGCFAAGVASAAALMVPVIAPARGVRMVRPLARRARR